MSTEPLTSLEGMAIAPESATVATLDAARAKLQARKVIDVSKLPTFFHEGLGISLHYGPMPSSAYVALENVTQFYPAGHPNAGQLASDAVLDDFNRDKILLMNGCWTADGKHLPEDFVLEMLAADGFGPSNLALVNKIKEKNPPRQVLITELQVLWAQSRYNAVFMEIARECDFWPLVLDYLTANTEDPQQKAKFERAKTMLIPIEESLDFFAAALDAAGLRRDLGIAPDSS